RRILSEADFLRSEIHTKWLDEMLGRPHAAPDVHSRAADAAAIAAALWHLTHNTTPPSESHGQDSRWKLDGRKQQLDRTP
ncbi:MAG TPA: hypothetical protein VEU98_00895, partial [Candidatus Eremiobacteraceae bacterium]|nr:hypothetical protein [Candidatus Eremiobacteraceae bacterium]